MKNFIIDVDFTMSKTIEIEAENEEQAMSLVDRMISLAPYDYARDFSHLVGHKIIDAYEQD